MSLALIVSAVVLGVVIIVGILGYAIDKNCNRPERKERNINEP